MNPAFATPLAVGARPAGATRLLAHRPSAPPRRPKPRRTAPHTAPAIRASSTEVPTHFGVEWYRKAAAPMDVELASHYIPNPTPAAPQTDFHFVDHARKFVAAFDYPADAPPPAVGPAAQRPSAEQLLDFIRDTVDSSQSAFSSFPTRDITHILAAVADRFELPPSFSAVLVDVSTNVLRLAYVGSCALVLVRDDKIVYRSYPNTADSFIDHISCSDTPSDSTHTERPEYSPEIHTDFFELQENDLVLAGTDGLFANLTDTQILAFVRPVPDSFDPTLAIANNTCLGSWTSDDAVFISYYLAMLATNFATATGTAPVLRYPFPPSPHLDDVTVVCATFSPAS